MVKRKREEIELGDIQNIINGYEIEIEQLKQRLEALQRQFEAQKLRKF